MKMTDLEFYEPVPKLGIGASIAIALLALVLIPTGLIVGIFKPYKQDSLYPKKGTK
jgi:hypothetical protein